MSDTPGIGMLGQGFMGRAHAHALITLAHMSGPPFIRPRSSVINSCVLARPLA